MAARCCVLSFTSVSAEPPIQRVQVTFTGAAPVRQIRRASGVSEVDAAGSTVGCLVCGSFQPFLEALRGHEVISLTSIPIEMGDAPK